MDKIKEKTLESQTSGNTLREIPEVVNNQAQSSIKNEPLNPWAERRKAILEKAEDVIVCRECQNILVKIKPSLEITEVEQLLVKHKCRETLITDKEQKISELEKELSIKWTKGTVKILDDFEKDNSKLTKITGVLTSNLRTRKSSDVPYMAFLWLEEIFERSKNNKLRKELFKLLPKHDNYEECAEVKCQECEIPVVFRIAKEDHNHLSGQYTCQFRYREFGETHWAEPKLKKGDKAILEGEFSPSEKSNRPSFTCYSYQVLKRDEE